MKKLAAILSFLVCLAATVDFGCADGFGGFGFIQLTVPTRTASPPSPFPTMVAGLDIPAGQTPTQASMSTGVPRCLDATWGSGCNISTTKCIQPTSGTPLESCQPPQQLVITGGSTSGGVGTINYTNPANIAYPVGEVLIVNGAIQSNWNTPIIHTTSAPTISGPNVTLNFAALPTAIPVGAPIYVSGITASDVAGQNRSFGFIGPNPNVPPGGAKFQTVTASTTTSVTYSMGATNQVIGKVTLTTQAAHPSGTASFSHVALTTLTGIGSGMTASVTCQSGVGLNFITIDPQSGSGYAVGDTATINSSLLGGQCGGSVFTVQVAVLTANSGGDFGTLIAPWTASASTCNPSTHVCSVSFPTANSCSSGCIDNTAQIVAGENADLVMSWHYGEQVPNSLQNGQVLACVDAKQISGVNFVSFSLDGGAFAKVSSPSPDPRGPGKSGLSIANTPIYCAQFAASSVPDGLHEVVAIGCPNVGYCGILNSNFTADATNGSAVLLSHNHGQQNFTKFGIRASTDPSFPNYNWNDSSNFVAGSTMSITGGSSGSGSLTINYSPPGSVPVFDVGTIVDVDATVTSGQTCLVDDTGGTSNGTTLVYNLRGTCSFPVGSSVNIVGIPVSGGNAFGWNGTIVPVTATSGPCVAGTCTISTPSLSTASFAPLAYTYTSISGSGGAVTAKGTTYSNVPSTGGSGSGGTVDITTNAAGGVTAVARHTAGTGYINGDVIGVNTTGFAGLAGLTGFSATVFMGNVTANWNGPCAVTSASFGHITCATNAATASWASGGNLTAQGNLMCNPGGNGDIPSPFNSFAVPAAGQMDPAHFQLVSLTIAAPLGQASRGNCQANQGQTGCEVTSASGNCGNVATKNETLWLTIFSSGLLQNKPAGWTLLNLRGSLFIYTNAGGTIQKQDAYVDSWGSPGVTNPQTCAGAVGAAGSAQVAFGGTPCSDLVHAKYALAATNMSSCASNGICTFTQAVMQGNITIGGVSTQCTLFTLTGNTSGASPYFIGEPVDFNGVDTNTSPKLRMFGLYFVVAAASDVLAIAATPGGPCINEAANISYSGAGTALLANDIGFDSILLQCNAALGCTTYDPVAKTGNPETYLEAVSVPVTVRTFSAKSSFLMLGPDVATPGKIATADSVSVNQGTNLAWFVGGGLDQGGRMRVAVDSSDGLLSLTAAVPIGPIPYFTTPVSGSLSACPSPNAAHQCETLNFPAVIDPATGTTNGAKYQAPTAAGSPGQSIVIFGTNDSASGHSWNCGVQGGNSLVRATPCNGNIIGGVAAPGIISSTPTSVTLVNDAAVGSLVYSYTLIVNSAGSGGTPGTYTNVALTPVTGGSVGPGGSGGFATVVIGSGGTVTSAVETTPGTNYVSGDFVTGSAGGNANFRLFVSTAFITPTNIIMELAAGSYGGTCADATTGVPIATPGAVFCAAMSSPTTGLGTNSNSYPAQMGGASYAIRNSNCFQLHDSTAGQGITSIQLNTVATGGAHDILSLTSDTTFGANVSSIGLNVENLCDGSGLGPFFFGQDMVLFTGMVDFWYDSQTNSGSDQENNVLGTGGQPQASGAFFITNSKRFDREEAMDAATYGWGNYSQYDCCSCIDVSAVEIENNCQNNGQSVIPISHGGTATTDLSINQGTPYLPILGSRDASGAEITCTDPTSGLPVPCITALSKTLEYATGTLPYNTVPNWETFTNCNMTSLPFNPSAANVINGGQIFAFNNNSSPATITFQPGINPVSSTCLVSQNPATTLWNGAHIDWDFIISGILTSSPFGAINGNTRAPWTYFSSYVQDNDACNPCGTMEGIAMQDGGNFDIAFNQMDGHLTQQLIRTGFSFHSYAVPGQSVVVINVSLTNSFMGTTVADNNSVSEVQDYYIINSTGGGNTLFPGPSTSSLNPANSGFWDGSAAVLFGGGITDFQAIWPTGTRSIDPVTGLPVGVAPPTPNSMNACPWFCTQTDTGLGSL